MYCIAHLSLDKQHRGIFGFFGFFFFKSKSDAEKNVIGIELECMLTGYE